MLLSDSVRLAWEQCMIIRNTELAASQEKFEEVRKRYEQVQANCSPRALVDKLQGMIPTLIQTAVMTCTSMCLQA